MRTAVLGHGQRQQREVGEDVADHDARAAGDVELVLADPAGVELRCDVVGEPEELRARLVRVVRHGERERVPRLRLDVVAHHVLPEGDRESADLPHGPMQGAQVVVIAGEVVRAGLPVGVDDEALGCSEHLHTLAVKAEEQIEVPGHAPEVLLQRRRGRVEGCEDQPVVGADLRSRGESVVFLTHSAECVSPQRCTDELAVAAVGPAVVRAAEVGGVARVGSANLNTPVPASIEQDVDLAGLVAGDDEVVLTDLADDVVTVRRDLRIVGQVHPAATEDLT